MTDRKKELIELVLLNQDIKPITNRKELTQKIIQELIDDFPKIEYILDDIVDTSMDDLIDIYDKNFTEKKLEEYYSIITSDVFNQFQNFQTSNNLLTNISELLYWNEVVLEKNKSLYVN